MPLVRGKGAEAPPPLFAGIPRDERPPLTTRLCAGMNELISFLGKPFHDAWAAGVSIAAQLQPQRPATVSRAVRSPPRPTRQVPKAALPLNNVRGPHNGRLGKLRGRPPVRVPWYRQPVSVPFRHRFV
jgi:hypothetical protein